MAEKSDPKKESGKVAAKETALTPKGYEKFLGKLKERARSAQLKRPEPKIRLTTREVASPELSNWVGEAVEDRRLGHQGFRLCVWRYEITLDSRSLTVSDPSI